MDRLEVARFTSLPEAEMAAGLLQRHGIDARVPDRDTATVVAHMQLALGGLRVTAPVDQINEARALIDQVRRGAFSEVVDEEDEALQAGQGMAPDEDLSEGDYKGLLSRMAPVVRVVGGGILVLALIGWISQLLGWL
jgi:hypothetical protein